MDSEDFGILLLVCFVVAALAFFGGLFLGDWGGTSRERQNAIKARVGKWQSDPSDGETTFVYGAWGAKPCAPVPTPEKESK